MIQNSWGGSVASAAPAALAAPWLLRTKLFVVLIETVSAAEEIVESGFGPKTMWDVDVTAVKAVDADVVVIMLAVATLEGAISELDTQELPTRFLVVSQEVQSLKRGPEHVFQCLSQDSQSLLPLL